MWWSGKKKNPEEQDSYKIAYLKLRNLLEKKSATIYSTPDENLNPPSILHVATK